MRRLRTPDWLTGASGIVLLASLFAPWYGDATGWEFLAFVDVWLALTALLAVGVLVVTATRDAPALPLTFGVLTVWASLVAVLMMIFRLLVEGDRSWGLYLAAVAVAGVLAGAWWGIRKQDQPGLRPPPEVRVMPTPPA